MGANASTAALGDDGPAKNSLVENLKESIEGKGDLAKFRAAWTAVEERRSRDPRLSQVRIDAALEFDDSIIKDGQYQVMSFVKHAFRHPDADWRLLGIQLAGTFFHLPEARQKLNNLDFVGSLLLITLPDDKNDEGAFQDDDDDKQAEKEREAEKNNQILAANIVCDMACYQDFLPSLCQTNVLNFLCIVLNQVPEAVEIITHTFSKLSEDYHNLALLMEGAVGDILESFFKTVPFVKNTDDDDEVVIAWKRNIKALSHCSRTLATLIKYDHPCQVDVARIIAIFKNANEEEYNPDNTHLLAEMARLLYWVCRQSPDVLQNLKDAAAQEGEGNIDTILNVLADLWERCVETNDLVTKYDTNGFIKQEEEKKFWAFMVDDIEKTKLQVDSKDFDDKLEHVKSRVCYTNCVLWVLLPNSTLRWKMRKMGLNKLYLAFDLTGDSEFLRVILTTVRSILDQPAAQECFQLVEYFGTELLNLLDHALNPEVDKRTEREIIKDMRTEREKKEAFNKNVVLLLDAICVLSMSREMQEMLSKRDMFSKLELLAKNMRYVMSNEQLKKIELAVLRIESQIAIHPTNRMEWVTKEKIAVPNYPPREPFTEILETRIKTTDQKETDDNFKTIASLLLTIFNERKFYRPVSDIETTFKSILDWWRVNTTARYEEDKDAAEAEASGIARPAAEVDEVPDLVDLLSKAMMMKATKQTITSMEAIRYCAPHECVLALSLFSRLALDPKFKRFFYDDALQALLGCVCVGIWAEAREAAATLANLMWLPDLNQERLVCWLKFDGPKCITVDAANVLLPVKIGNPRAADMGKGMYKSTWGIQFVEGTCVALHPDGLSTNSIPPMLTCATPSHTFEHTSKQPYQWLEAVLKPGSDPNTPSYSDVPYNPDPKEFSITCWFYWPLVKTYQSGQNVLVQSCSSNPMAQIYVDVSSDPKGVWTLTNEEGRRQPLKTPELSKGWHMLALVSGNFNANAKEKWKGTKFFLDDWHCRLENFFVKNEFYMVGNDAGHGGKKPFGLMCDFRIYARSMDDKEIKAMVTAKEEDAHPDRIVRKLADYNAAKILAQRLDVPDSAAECLRALGSLATLRSQRSLIFSVCGDQVLKLLDSPLPMIHRQSARVLNNIT